MRTHQVFGGTDNDFYLLCEIEDPRGEYVNPAKDVHEINVEVNDIATLEGDKAFMGEINGSPTFFMVDKGGNISFFRRLYSLQSWAMDRYNAAHPEPHPDDNRVEFPGGEFPY